MLICGLDPGTESTGVCVLDVEPSTVRWAGELDNDELLSKLRYRPSFTPDVVSLWDRLYVETIAPMGLVLGASTLETMRWVGRFQEAWERSTDRPAVLVFRNDEKLVLCGRCTYPNPRTGRPKAVGDAEIRRALIDRFPGTGGGKTPQIGTKREPGPLFGMRGHAWSALAVLVTGMELEKDGRNVKNGNG